MLDLLGQLLVEIENKKNSKAGLARWSKLKDWTSFSNRVERHFLYEAEKAKETGFFCSLYVSKEKEHKQVQLSTGNHPTGEKVPVQNNQGITTGKKLISENGGALVLSQSTLGDVAIILYPLHSENLSRVKDKIIWTVKASPGNISSRLLDSAVNDFLIYLRVSSSRLNESWMDRVKISYLEFRSSKYEGKGNIAKIIFSKWLIPAIIVFAAIVTIFSGVKSLAQ